MARSGGLAVWRGVFAGLAGLCLGIAAAVRADQASLTDEARAMADAFGAQLRQTLLEAIAAGGPVEAIAVCKLQAPGIAAELSTGGWQLRRTALRVRNPDNAPTLREREVLEWMQGQLKGGANPANLTSSRLEVEAGNTVFYYMQPIMTAALCLNCHGEELAPEVRKAIRASYPQDRATGFSEGDLRGAFSFTRRLQAPSAQ